MERNHMFSEGDIVRVRPYRYNGQEEIPEILGLVVEANWIEVGVPGQSLRILAEGGMTRYNGNSGRVMKVCD